MIHCSNCEPVGMQQGNMLTQLHGAPWPSLRCVRPWAVGPMASQHHSALVSLHPHITAMPSHHSDALTSQRCPHITAMPSHHSDALTSHRCPHITPMPSHHTDALTSHRCPHITPMPSHHTDALTSHRCPHLQKNKIVTTTQFPRRLIKEKAEVRQSQGSVPPFTSLAQMSCTTAECMPFLQSCNQPHSWPAADPSEN
jgi:hypothetical protein